MQHDWWESILMGDAKATFGSHKKHIGSTLTSWPKVNRLNFLFLFLLMVVWSLRECNVICKSDCLWFLKSNSYPTWSSLFALFPSSEPCFYFGGSFVYLTAVWILAFWNSYGLFSVLKDSFNLLRAINCFYTKHKGNREWRKEERPT